MECPVCGSKYAKCPECNKVYPHGEKSNCDNPPCVEVNAPLDCSGCGYVISQDLQGVLNFEMELIKYQS